MPSYPTSRFPDSQEPEGSLNTTVPHVFPVAAMTSSLHFGPGELPASLVGVIAYVVPLCAKCTTHPPRCASHEGGGDPDVASESIWRTQLPPRGERSCTNTPLPTREQ